MLYSNKGNYNFKISKEIYNMIIDKLDLDTININNYKNCITVKYEVLNWWINNFFYIY